MTQHYEHTTQHNKSHNEQKGLWSSFSSWSPSSSSSSSLLFRFLFVLLCFLIVVSFVCLFVIASYVRQQRRKKQNHSLNHLLTVLFGKWTFSPKVQSSRWTNVPSFSDAADFFFLVISLVVFCSFTKLFLFCFFPHFCSFLGNVFLSFVEYHFGL